MEMRELRLQKSVKLLPEEGIDENPTTLGKCLDALNLRKEREVPAIGPP